MMFHMLLIGVLVEPLRSVNLFMFLPLSKEIDNQKLIESIDVIRKEYQTFLQKDYFVDYGHEQELTFNPELFPSNARKTGYFWQVCPLVFDKKIPKSLPKDICDSFIVRLIMSFSVKPVLAVFSMLEPGSIVEPHFDSDNHIGNIGKKKSTVVKYHFSVDIPDEGECALQVLNEKRILKNGDINPFDETKIHSAYNKSCNRRGVLIISYLKNELYPIKPVSL